MYNKITSKVIEQFRGIVGKANVLLPSDDIESYTHDETEDFRFVPEAVVKPASAEEISRLLKLCNERRIPVTPRAGGTSLSGGALPVYGGVVLSVERMNRILEIDRENLMAVAEPAVITQVLQEEVEKHGLFYPPDPASRGSCMLGGNVAHNAGGPRALKYGVTKDFVYGLEAVLPSGEIIHTGGKLLKNVTGYNLTQLLVGSEGTLAVVTKIILKLLPLPKSQRTMLAPFPDVVSAARAVTQIFHHKIIPCACEFIEGAAIRAVEQKRGLKFPHSDASALLLIEVDGNDSALLEHEAEQIGEICLEQGAADAVVATDPEKRAFLWTMRRSIGEAVKALSPYKEEDTVVPRARLPELMQAIQEVCAKYGLTSMSYGHIGDGNVHVNILKLGVSDEKWQKELPQAVRELFERVVALGGTLSGEHGIGYVQKNYMPLALGKVELDLMRGLKRLFDPNNILNPGKVLPYAPERVK